MQIFFEEESMKKMKFIGLFSMYHGDKTGYIVYICYDK